MHHPNRFVIQHMGFVATTLFPHHDASKSSWTQRSWRNDLPTQEPSEEHMITPWVTWNTACDVTNWLAQQTKNQPRQTAKSVSRALTRCNSISFHWQLHINSATETNLLLLLCSLGAVIRSHRSWWRHCVIYRWLQRLSCTVGNVGCQVLKRKNMI